MKQELDRARKCAHTRKQVTCGCGLFCAQVGVDV